MGRLSIASLPMLLVVFVPLASLGSVGCGEQQSDQCSAPPDGCPRSTFVTTLRSGSMTYQIGSAAPVTEALRVGDASASQEGCVVEDLSGEVFSNEFVNASGPTVRCSTPTGYVYVNLHGLADPRAWSVGEISRLGPNVEYSDCPRQQSGHLCAPCVPSVDDAPISIVVDEAAGAAAPYPRMVTSDFRRTYRIEIDTGLRAAAAAGATCQKIAVKLTLELEQTAASYDDTPHGACPPCE